MNDVPTRMNQTMNDIDLFKKHKVILPLLKENHRDKIYVSFVRAKIIQTSQKCDKNSEFKVKI